MRETRHLRAQVKLIHLLLEEPDLHHLAVEAQQLLVGDFAGSAWLGLFDLLCFSHFSKVSSFQFLVSSREVRISFRGTLNLKLETIFSSPPSPPARRRARRNLFSRAPCRARR